MTHKIFIFLVLAVALIMGILGVVLPEDRLRDFVMLMSFVETMLPILAVGALLKYIFALKSDDG